MDRVYTFPSPIEQDDALALEGMTQAEAAKKFGVTQRCGRQADLSDRTVTNRVRMASIPA